MPSFCLMGKSTVRGDQRLWVSKLQLNLTFRKSGEQIKTGFSCNNIWRSVLRCWVFNPARKPGLQRASAGLQLPNPSHRQQDFLFDEKSCLRDYPLFPTGDPAPYQHFLPYGKGCRAIKIASFGKRIYKKCNRIFRKLVQSELHKPFEIYICIVLATAYCQVGLWLHFYDWCYYHHPYFITIIMIKLPSAISKARSFKFLNTPGKKRVTQYHCRHTCCRAGPVGARKPYS